VSSWVLDASALLALLHSEPGSERVAAALPDAEIASVNFSEVVAKLANEGQDKSEIRPYLDALGLVIVEFDIELAYQTGFLRPLTRMEWIVTGRSCVFSVSRVFGCSSVDVRSRLDNAKFECRCGTDSVKGRDRSFPLSPIAVSV
jgi:ribonuclease VapC